jgi:hypothetical protein
MSEPLEGTSRSQATEPALDAGFDSYQSLAYPDVRIIVAKDVAAPFRFKAGGWELFNSSTEVGSAMKARITGRGYFLFRVNEDQTGGIELNDFPMPPA